MVVYTGLALFAGAGGLELGLSLALGEHYRTVAYVEREASSAAVLAANMEKGWLDKGVIWDDVTTFTGDVVSPFVDNIDIMSAGFPCQPWSVAGNRKGTDDDRWLWPHIFRLVREIRPRSIFLENVPGLLHGGIEHVLGDLASVGFDAEWTCLRASDVGAPHRRERVFILANSSNLSGQVSSPSRADGTSRAVAAGSSGALGNANGNGLSAGRHREREHEVRDNGDRSPSEDQQLRGVGQSGAGEGSEALGDTGSERLEGSHSDRESSDRVYQDSYQRHSELADPDGAGLKQSDNPVEGRPPEQPDSRGGELAYSSSPGLQRGLLGRGTNEERRKESDGRAAAGNESLVDTISQRGRGWHTGGEYAEHAFPPGPSASAEWRDILSQRPDLAPATLKPEVRRMDDGVARGLARTQQLRILGNGVVPQQAALAFQILKERN